MSRENVELVQTVFEAWNARDLDTLYELYDPNVVVWAAADWPEPGPFVGPEAVIRQGEQLRETWDSVTLEPIGDFIDAGDRVVVRHIWRAAGHGPETSNLEFTLVVTIRKGKILSFEYFRDHVEAAEVLGLSDQATRTRDMPQEAVEVVTAMYRAWDAGDWGLERFHPDIEFNLIGNAGFDLPDTIHGRNALLEYFKQFWGAWKPGAHWDIKEFLRLDDEHVLACGNLHATGRSSGIETSAAIFHLWTVRDGLIVKLVGCDDRATALAAAS